jgi:hypothetical protein
MRAKRAIFLVRKIRERFARHAQILHSIEILRYAQDFDARLKRRNVSTSFRMTKRFQRQRDFLPIWSCSVWGLPCPRDHSRGGALLPHLFTLTPPFSSVVVDHCLQRERTRTAGRYVFCGTFRPSGLNLTSRTLSGTLLCGVRTFLPHHLTRQERPPGPAAYASIIRASFRGL